MNIVLEGPDATGKSTLAKALAHMIGRPIIEGRGPPRSPLEMEQRIATYAGYRKVIFDRHPVISQQVYGTLRDPPESLPTETILDFWASAPLVIYCRRNGPPISHVIKPGEDPEHVHMVEKKDVAIRALYDDLLLPRAPFLYTIGAPIPNLIYAIKGYVNAG